MIEVEGDAFIDMFWLKKMKQYNNNNTDWLLVTTQYLYAQDIYKLLSFFSIAAHVDHSIFFSTAYFTSDFFFLLYGTPM